MTGGVQVWWRECVERHRKQARAVRMPHLALLHLGEHSCLINLVDVVLVFDCRAEPQDLTKTSLNDVALHRPRLEHAVDHIQRLLAHLVPVRQIAFVCYGVCVCVCVCVCVLVSSVSVCVSVCVSVRCYTCHVCSTTHARRKHGNKRGSSTHGSDVSVSATNASSCDVGGGERPHDDGSKSLTRPATYDRREPFLG
jgi:hypothetical protein